MPKKIEISHRTIIFTFALLGMIWFLFFIKDILLQVFVALLIMTILNPTVSKLNKRFKIPRAASVLIVYIMVLALLTFTFVAIIPPLIDQSTSFANNLPSYLDEYNIPIFVIDEVSKQFSSLVGQIPSQVLRIAVSVVSNLITVLTVLFLALYFLLSRERIDDNLETFLSKRHAQKIDDIIVKLEKFLGGWARGQLFLMLLVGFSTYFGLLILNVPYAVPLALLAGLLEIVPNVGPLLAAIPAIMVGMGVSPLTGLAVAALTFLIQQLEYYLFVPKVMEKSAGVSPVVTLLALLVGFKVAGILGAILSVPVVITLKVILGELYFKDLLKPNK